jgi:hypothetical protein
MKDTTASNPSRAAVEPPGGGRQDHDVMRAAAMRQVSGGSTDTLAAIGALDVPGHEAHPELANHPHGSDFGGDAPGGPAPHEPIPGERDATTLTHREPGAVGGQFAGADTPSPDTHAWMDERTAREHAREGGGPVARTPKH